jgi:hypothetical protein
LHTLLSLIFRDRRKLGGKKVIIVGWGTGDEAKKIIRTTVNSYREIFGRSQKKKKSSPEYVFR